MSVKPGQPQNVCIAVYVDEAVGGDVPFQFSAGISADLPPWMMAMATVGSRAHCRSESQTTSDSSPTIRLGVMTFIGLARIPLDPPSPQGLVLEKSSGGLVMASEQDLIEPAGRAGAAVHEGILVAGVVLIREGATGAPELIAQVVTHTAAG
jgi:hypothetical protein